jgi:hypothetical protein
MTAISFSSDAIGWTAIAIGIADLLALYPVWCILSGRIML